MSGFVMYGNNIYVTFLTHIWNLPILFLIIKFLICSQQNSSSSLLANIYIYILKII